MYNTAVLKVSDAKTVQLKPTSDKKSSMAVLVTTVHVNVVTVTVTFTDFTG